MDMNPFVYHLIELWDYCRQNSGLFALGGGGATIVILIIRGLLGDYFDDVHRN